MKLKKIISLALTLMMSSTLLVGCGQSKKSAEVLNIYNVGDYIDEDLITKFEEETGITVVYETYDTNESMYQKLKSGSTKYDLVFPSDYMVEKLIAEDMVAPIDYSKIPNYKYIIIHMGCVWIDFFIYIHNLISSFYFRFHSIIWLLYK